MLSAKLVLYNVFPIAQVVSILLLLAVYLAYPAITWRVAHRIAKAVFHFVPTVLVMRLLDAVHVLLDIFLIVWPKVALFNVSPTAEVVLMVLMLTAYPVHLAITRIAAVNHVQVVSHIVTTVPMLHMLAVLIVLLDISLIVLDRLAHRCVLQTARVVSTVLMLAVYPV